MGARIATTMTLRIDTTDEVTKDLSRLVELIEHEGVDIDQVIEEVE
jgi:hypothetical protein